MRRLPATVVAVLAILGALVVGCTADGGDPTAIPTPVVPTSPAPATSSPTPSPSPQAPTPEAVRWPETPPDVPTVELEPRGEAPPPPDRTVTLSEPQSPFPTQGWDLDRVLLYDFERLEVEDLGPSTWGGGRFSPDGRYFLWVTPRVEGPARMDAQVLHVRDLASATEREFDVSFPLMTFVAPHLVILGETLVDLESGSVRPIENLPDGQGVHEYDSGLLIRSEMVDKSGGSWEHHFVVWTGFEGRPLLRVTGLKAEVADEDTIAVMTAALDGRASIYLVDVRTLEPTFVADVTQAIPGDLRADGDRVAWVEDSCGFDEARRVSTARARVWDARSGSITEFEGVSFLADLRGNAAASGDFGPRAWFDVETGEWLAVLPTSGELAGWSDDLRFASVGALLGHGGRCGGG